MSEQSHHILMRYRGAPEARERALASGATAVKDFLDQFEGDEKIGAALEIASELGSVIQDERGEDEAATFYATEIANPGILRNLADNIDGLRWVSGVAGVAEHMCRPIDVAED